MAQARDLSRFLQQPTPRERAARRQAALAALPSHVGPAQFSILGALVAVRCPHDLDRLMKKAGGLWEPGSRQWLIEPRRMNPLIRDLRRTTDPLFRQAGMEPGRGGRLMARQVVDKAKLAEAQEAADAAVEAADAAMEAAKLAAEKVAEIANPEKPPKAQEADGGGMAGGYRIIRDGPEGFSVEGFFRQDGSQRFSSAKGFSTEAAARQWVYDQQAAEDG